MNAAVGILLVKTVLSNSQIVMVSSGSVVFVVNHNPMRIVIMSDG